jgi:hypothetical protein
VNRGKLGGVSGQCVRVSQVRRQRIGRHEQNNREQNAQCFHDLKLALLEFYEIGSAPFLLSVFG